MKKNLLYLLLLLLWIVGGLYFMYTYLCSPDLITKIVEKKVEVEKRVEIPVEKIVEKRVEVPLSAAKIQALKDSLLLTLQKKKPVEKIKDEVKKVVEKIKPKDPFKNWTIADGDRFSVSADHYFKNKLDSDKFLAYSKDFTGGLNQTATYLKKNNNRSVEIIGYYKAEEKNASIFPDLGLARANAAKLELTKLGVSAQQINTKSKKITLLNKNWISNDTLKRSIDFKFGAFQKDAATKKLAKIKSRLFGKPLTVYFASNSENIELSKEQRNDINDIIYYLDNASKSSLAVEGHTDGTGNRNFNVSLSEKRANIVKDYLVKNGKLESGKLKVKGFGPDKPIADNSTADGRAKNRRVELILK